MIGVMTYRVGQLTTNLQEVISSHMGSRANARWTPSVRMRYKYCTESRSERIRASEMNIFKGVIASHEISGTGRYPPDLPYGNGQLISGNIVKETKIELIG